MARISGTHSRTSSLSELNTQLRDKHGEGVLYLQSQIGFPQDTVDYIYEYVPGFQHSEDAGVQKQVDFDKPDRYPTTKLLDDIRKTRKLLDAIHVARVKMTNMSAVKIADDGIRYVPIDPEDQNAQQTCGTINLFAEILNEHNYKYEHGISGTTLTA